MVNTHKARWADRKAAKLRQRLQERAYVPAGNWRRVRDSLAGDAAMLAEIAKYERLARIYRGEPSAANEPVPF